MHFKHNSNQIANLLFVKGQKLCTIMLQFSFLFKVHEVVQIVKPTINSQAWRHSTYLPTNQNIVFLFLSDPSEYPRIPVGAPRFNESDVRNVSFTYTLWVGTNVTDNYTLYMVAPRYATLLLIVKYIHSLTIRWIFFQQYYKELQSKLTWAPPWTPWPCPWHFPIGTSSFVSQKLVKRTYHSLFMLIHQFPR